MELDQRILPGKRPLTCFDVEEAEKYIGKECYFTSRFENFENLSKVPHATLHNIDDSSTPFWCYGDDGVLCYDCFILPCEWVKESEKKYKAFTIKEFQQKYSVGSVLKIRQKQNRFDESFVQYVGYKKYEERIYLGITDFTLDELFENFEMIEPQNDTWHPFGVEE